MMNEKDELRLQRLVDGEMGDWERRVFLAGLDDEPEGWRHVALAFLEDQALRASLGPEIPAATPSRVGRERGRHWVRPLALAAGLFLTLGLGLALGRLWAPTNDSPETDLVRLPVPDPQSPDAPTGPTISPDGPTERNFLPGGALAYEFTVEHKGDTVEVHAIPTWSPAEPFPDYELPEALRKALAGSGYRVERDTQYWPVRSEDGRQVVVPVHTVAVAPHGQ